MFTRAQLHRRRSHLARAWDLHIPAICDKRPASAERAGVRTEIVASWERSAAHIMPEVHEAPLSDVDETRRAWEASPLSAAVRQLESQLQAAADDGELVVAVTDPAARILWTYGGAVMRRKAEKVNFIPGGRWDEASVGTNALDLALRLDHPATVYSAEHFSSCVHGWVCWAAPVHDPLYRASARRARSFHDLGSLSSDRPGHGRGPGPAAGTRGTRDRRGGRRTQRRQFL